MPRALLLFSFTAFMIAVDMLLVAPILPMLMAELSIPRVLSGAISASYAAAYAVTSLLMAPRRFARSAVPTRRAPYSGSSSS